MTNPVIWVQSTDPRALHAQNGDYVLTAWTDGRWGVLCLDTGPYRCIAKRLDGRADGGQAAAQHAAEAAMREHQERRG